jgi:hypothetical protein
LRVSLLLLLLLHQLLLRVSQLNLLLLSLHPRLQKRSPRNHQVLLRLQRRAVRWIR